MNKVVVQIMLFFLNKFGKSTFSTSMSVFVCGHEYSFSTSGTIPLNAFYGITLYFKELVYLRIFIIFFICHLFHLFYLDSPLAACFGFIFFRFSLSIIFFLSFSESFLNILY